MGYGRRVLKLKNKYQAHIRCAILQQYCYQVRGMNNMSGHRRLYEVILSNNSSIQEKEMAIMSLLKLSFTDHSHYNFLFNQINWFEGQNLPLIYLLKKIIRLYRGTSKSAGKVVYNLIAEGMCIPEASSVIVETAVESLENSKDSVMLVNCLRENYPHKVCPLQNHQSYLGNLLLLCEKLPQYRIKWLEIIIQNLVTFDTEITLGEDFLSQVFPQDHKILNSQHQSTEFEHKYAVLLSKLMAFLDQSQEKEKIFNELLEIFQSTILNVDKTKTIQYILYYLSSTDKKLSKTLVSFLLNIILTNYQLQGSKRKFKEANFYICSFIHRSKTISAKKVKKLILILMKEYKDRVSKLPQKSLENIEKVNMDQFAQENEKNIQILQSILILGIYNENIKASLKNEFNELIQYSHERIFFKYFINNEILSQYGVKELKEKRKKVFKYEHKFLPTILPQISNYINEDIFKFNSSAKRIRVEVDTQEGSVRKRKHMESQKSTPITNRESEYYEHSFQC